MNFVRHAVIGFLLVVTATTAHAQNPIYPYDVTKYEFVQRWNQKYPEQEIKSFEQFIYALTEHPKLPSLSFPLLTTNEALEIFADFRDYYLQNFKPEQLREAIPADKYFETLSKPELRWQYVRKQLPLLPNHFLIDFLLKRSGLGSADTFCSNVTNDNWYRTELERRKSTAVATAQVEKIVGPIVLTIITTPASTNSSGEEGSFDVKQFSFVQRWNREHLEDQITSFDELGEHLRLKAIASTLSKIEALEILAHERDLIYNYMNENIGIEYRGDMPGKDSSDWLSTNWQKIVKKIPGLLKQYHAFNYLHQAAGIKSTDGRNIMADVSSSKNCYKEKLNEELKKPFLFEESISWMPDKYKLAYKKLFREKEQYQEFRALKQEGKIPQNTSFSSNSGIPGLSWPLLNLNARYAYLKLLDLTGNWLESIPVGNDNSILIEQKAAISLWNKAHLNDQINWENWNEKRDKLYLEEKEAFKDRLYRVGLDEHWLEAPRYSFLESLLEVRAKLILYNEDLSKNSEGDPITSSSSNTRIRNLLGVSDLSIVWNYLDKNHLTKEWFFSPRGSDIEKQEWAYANQEIAVATEEQVKKVAGPIVLTLITGNGQQGPLLDVKELDYVKRLKIEHPEIPIDEFKQLDHILEYPRKSYLEPTPEEASQILEYIWAPISKYSNENRQALLLDEPTESHVNDLLAVWRKIKPYVHEAFSYYETFYHLHEVAGITEEDKIKRMITHTGLNPYAVLREEVENKKPGMFYDPVEIRKNLMLGPDDIVSSLGIEFVDKPTNDKTASVQQEKPQSITVSQNGSQNGSGTTSDAQIKNPDLSGKLYSFPANLIAPLNDWMLRQFQTLDKAAATGNEQVVRLWLKKPLTQNQLLKGLFAAIDHHQEDIYYLIEADSRVNYHMKSQCQTRRKLVHLEKLWAEEKKNPDQKMSIEKFQELFHLKAMFGRSKNMREMAFDQRLQNPDFRTAISSAARHLEDKTLQIGFEHYEMGTTQLTEILGEVAVMDGSQDVVNVILSLGQISEKPIRKQVLDGALQMVISELDQNNDRHERQADYAKYKVEHSTYLTLDGLYQILLDPVVDPILKSQVAGLAIKDIHPSDYSRVERFENLISHESRVGSRHFHDALSEIQKGPKWKIKVNYPNYNDHLNSDHIPPSIPQLSKIVRGFDQPAMISQYSTEQIKAMRELYVHRINYLKSRAVINAAWNGDISTISELIDTYGPIDDRTYRELIVTAFDIEGNENFIKFLSNDPRWPDALFDARVYVETSGNNVAKSNIQKYDLAQNKSQPPHLSTSEKITSIAQKWMTFMTNKNIATGLSAVFAVPMVWDDQSTQTKLDPAQSNGTTENGSASFEYNLEDVKYALDYKIIPGAEPRERVVLELSQKSWKELSEMPEVKVLIRSNGEVFLKYAKMISNVNAFQAIYSHPDLPENVKLNPENIAFAQDHPVIETMGLGPSWADIQTTIQKAFKGAVNLFKGENETSKDVVSADEKANGLLTDKNEVWKDSNETIKPSNEQIPSVNLTRDKKEVDPVISVFVRVEDQIENKSESFRSLGEVEKELKRVDLPEQELTRLAFKALTKNRMSIFETLLEQKNFNPNARLSKNLSLISEAIDFQRFRAFTDLLNHKKTDPETKKKYAALKNSRNKFIRYAEITDKSSPEALGLLTKTQVAAEIPVTLTASVNLVTTDPVSELQKFPQNSPEDIKIKIVDAALTYKGNSSEKMTEVLSDASSDIINRALEEINLRLEAPTRQRTAWMPIDAIYTLLKSPNINPAIAMRTINLLKEKEKINADDNEILEELKSELIAQRESQITYLSDPLTPEKNRKAAFAQAIDQKNASIVRKFIEDPLLQKLLVEKFHEAIEKSNRIESNQVQWIADYVEVALIRRALKEMEMSDSVFGYLENIVERKAIEEKENASAVHDRIKTIQNAISEKPFNSRRILNYINELRNNKKHPEKWTAWLEFEKASGINLQKPDLTRDYVRNFLGFVEWVHTHEKIGTKVKFENVVALKEFGKIQLQYFIKNVERFDEAVLNCAENEVFGVPGNKILPNQQITKDMLTLCKFGNSFEETYALKENYLKKYSFDTSTLEKAFETLFMSPYSHGVNRLEMFETFLQNTDAGQGQYDHLVMDKIKNRTDIRDEFRYAVEPYMSLLNQKIITLIDNCEANNFEEVEKTFFDSDITEEIRKIAIKSAVYTDGFDVVKFFGQQPKLRSLLTEILEELIVDILMFDSDGKESSEKYKIIDLLANYSDREVVDKLSKQPGLMSKELRNVLVRHASASETVNLMGENAVIYRNGDFFGITDKKVIDFFTTTWKKLYSHFSGNKEVENSKAVSLLYNAIHEDIKRGDHNPNWETRIPNLLESNSPEVVGEVLKNFGVEFLESAMLRNNFQSFKALIRSPKINLQGDKTLIVHATRVALEVNPASPDYKQRTQYLELLVKNNQVDPNGYRLGEPAPVAMAFLMGDEIVFDLLTSNLRTQMTVDIKRFDNMDIQQLTAEIKQLSDRKLFNLDQKGILEIFNYNRQEEGHINIAFKVEKLKNEKSGLYKTQKALASNDANVEEILWQLVRHTQDKESAQLVLQSEKMKNWHINNICLEIVDRLSKEVSENTIGVENGFLYRDGKHGDLKHWLSLLGEILLDPRITDETAEKAIKTIAPFADFKTLNDLRNNEKASTALREAIRTELNNTGRSEEFASFVERHDKLSSSGQKVAGIPEQNGQVGRSGILGINFPWLAGNGDKPGYLNQLWTSATGTPVEKLIMYIQKNDLNRFQFLLADKQIKFSEEESKSLLKIAIQPGKSEFLNILFDKPEINPDLLIDILKNKNFEVDRATNLLLLQKATAHSIYFQKRELLQTVMSLEEIDPNIEDNRGKTQLGIATSFFDLETSKILMSNKKTNPNIESGTGYIYTPLGTLLAPPDIHWESEITKIGYFSNEYTRSMYYSLKHPTFRSIYETNQKKNHLDLVSLFYNDSRTLLHKQFYGGSPFPGTDLHKDFLRALSELEKQLIDLKDKRDPSSQKFADLLLVMKDYKTRLNNESRSAENNRPAGIFLTMITSKPKNVKSDPWTLERIENEIIKWEKITGKQIIDEDSYNKYRIFPKSRNNKGKVNIPPYGAFVALCKDQQKDPIEFLSKIGEGVKPEKFNKQIAETEKLISNSDVSDEKLLDSEEPSVDKNKKIDKSKKVVKKTASRRGGRAYAFEPVTSVLASLWKTGNGILHWNDDKNTKSQISDGVEFGDGKPILPEKEKRSLTLRNAFIKYYPKTVLRIDGIANKKVSEWEKQLDQRLMGEVYSKTYVQQWIDQNGINALQPATKEYLAKLGFEPSTNLEDGKSLKFYRYTLHMLKAKTDYPQEEKQIEKAYEKILRREFAQYKENTLAQRWSDFWGNGKKGKMVNGSTSIGSYENFGDSGFNPMDEFNHNAPTGKSGALSMGGFSGTTELRFNRLSNASKIGDLRVIQEYLDRSTTNSRKIQQALFTTAVNGKTNAVNLIKDHPRVKKDNILTDEDIRESFILASKNKRLSTMEALATDGSMNSETFEQVLAKANPEDKEWIDRLNELKTKYFDSEGQRRDDKISDRISERKIADQSKSSKTIHGVTNKLFNSTYLFGLNFLSDLKESFTSPRQPPMAQMRTLSGQTVAINLEQFPGDPLDKLNKFFAVLVGLSQAEQEEVLAKNRAVILRLHAALTLNPTQRIALVRTLSHLSQASGQFVNNQPREFGKFFAAMTIAHVMLALKDKNLSSETFAELLRSIPTQMTIVPVFNAASSATVGVMTQVEMMTLKLLQQYGVVGQQQIRQVMTAHKGVGLTAALKEQMTSKAFVKGQFGMLAANMVMMWIENPDLSIEEVWDASLKQTVNFAVTGLIVRQLGVRALAGLSGSSSALLEASRVGWKLKNIFRITPVGVLTFAVELYLVHPIGNFIDYKLDVSKFLNASRTSMNNWESYMTGEKIGRDPDPCVKDTNRGACAAQMLVSSMQAYQDEIVYRPAQMVIRNYIQEQMMMDEQLDHIVSNERNTESVISKVKNVSAYQQLWDQTQIRAQVEVKNVLSGLDPTFKKQVQFVSYWMQKLRENVGKCDWVKMPDQCGFVQIDYQQQLNQSIETLLASTTKEQEELNLMILAARNFDLISPNLRYEWTGTEWSKAMLGTTQRLVSTDPVKEHARSLLLAQMLQAVIQGNDGERPVWTDPKLFQEKIKNGYVRPGYWASPEGFGVWGEIYLEKIHPNTFSVGTTDQELRKNREEIQRIKTLAAKVPMDLFEKTNSFVLPQDPGSRSLFQDSLMLDVAYMKKCDKSDDFWSEKIALSQNQKYQQLKAKTLATFREKKKATQKPEKENHNWRFSTEEEWATHQNQQQLEIPEMFVQVFEQDDAPRFSDKPLLRYRETIGVTASVLQPYTDFVSCIQ